MSNESNWAGATLLAAEFSGFQTAKFAATWTELATTTAAPFPQPQLHLFETLPSTNQKLWDLIAQGAGPGTAVLALQQEAGRGQWGRQWVSPPGGLYLSLAIAPQIPIAQTAQLALAGAWGIAQLLRQFKVPVQIKWPNDLLLYGRKLGGILTETRIQREQITQAVVGVGINWSNPVPDPGICLQAALVDPDTHPIHSLEMVAAIALWGLLSGFHGWQTLGVPALLSGYTHLLANLGDIIEFEGQAGTIVGISAEGQLRVRPILRAEGSDSKSEIWLNPGAIRLGYSQ